jgi:hypothetical protein
MMDTAERLDVLFERRAELDVRLVKLKEQIATTNDEINEIVKPAAEMVFQCDGKVDGTVRFAIGNQIYKAEIGKTVVYDSDELQKIAGSLPFEQSASLFQVKFSISAKSFDDTEGELREALIKARTVKYSDMKITRV